MGVKLGHEQAHLYMTLILIAGMVGLQILVFVWKRRHYKSYQLALPAHLLLLDGAEPYLSDHLGFVLAPQLLGPLHHLTPRLVYKWFSVTHHISFIVGVIGYVTVMTLMFFVPPPEEDSLGESSAISLPFVFLMYGLYFGILSRDFAEFCSNRMAATLGFYVEGGLPNKQLRENMCAICGGALRGKPTASEAEPNSVYDESIHKLDCQHEFHEKCIRGWCIIGKKHSCPYCHEKVSLKALSHNPWDTQQELYLNLLDYLRYLIVWVPVLTLVISGSYRLLGLK
ncbi:hypothetical protein L0F63_001361 [Massospora cicadina]|nr:hypothetical protein L0F63_001361 [Massospora cicadina]